MELAEQQLRTLEITLPPAPKPLGAYKPCNRQGNLLYTSGVLSFDQSGELIVGRVGESLSAEQGKLAARAAALTALAALRAELGSLNRIVAVVRVVGFIQCTADFADHPHVMNGASDLLQEIFGEEGRHARLALGAHSLPKNAAVELEMIVSVT